MSDRFRPVRAFLQKLFGQGTDQAIECPTLEGGDVVELLAGPSYRHYYSPWAYVTVGPVPLGSVPFTLARGHRGATVIMLTGTATLKTETWTREISSHQLVMIAPSEQCEIIGVRDGVFVVCVKVWEESVE